MASQDRELESPPARAKPSKARVLVVEDDAIVGSDIKLTLVRLGYAVVGPLPAAVDAMAMVLKHQPDVVLMDIHTKGSMDGVEAARILRQRMRVPVIFLTAHSDPETVKRAGQVEPLGYVVKPFKAADLASVIEVALHRHAAENAMRERDLKLAALTARLTAAIESLDGAVVIENEAGRVELMNKQFRQLLLEAGTEPPPDSERRDMFDVVASLLNQSSRERMPITDPQFASPERELLERLDGRFLELSAAPTVVNGLYAGCLWTFRDVTEREQTKRALKAQSLVDELTGLHNRRGLNAAAALALREAQRSNTRLAVYFVDLNGMKATNDAYGHEVGDALLRRTAEVLRSTCRGGDIVARLGGDEFVVVSMLEPPGEQHLLTRIKAAAHAHNLAHQGQPPVHMSIGLALADPAVEESFEALLARADGAMYADKQVHRSTGAYEALGRVK